MDDMNQQLHDAALRGDLEACKTLISQGAEVNKRNKDGWTALLCAANNGHLDVTVYLVSQGAEHDATDPVYIHLAIQHGRTSFIEMLVSQGADLNVLSNDGQTCLHQAIQLCYKIDRSVDETEILRKISEKFYQGKLSPEKALVFYLLENGAKSDVRDMTDNLPIHYAKDDIVNLMILSSSTEPVRDDLLDELSKNMPHTQYIPVCNKLLPEEYNGVKNILVKNHNDYGKATREVLGIWKFRTGGRSFELWKILQEVELGGLWHLHLPRQGSRKILEGISIGGLSAPPDILARGLRAQQGYAEAARAGTKKVFRTRLMLVGQKRVGKTSLKKSLTGQGFDENEAITDGVEITNACEISVEVAKAGGTMWSFDRKVDGSFDTKGDEYSKALADEIAKKLIVTTQDPGSLEPQSDTTDGRASLNQEQAEADHRMPNQLASLVENSLKKQIRMKESGTDGIDGGKDDGISLSIWDFAGDDIYYTTHQVFLTWRGIYVIVFDLSRSLDSVVHPEFRDKEYEEAKGGGKSELTCLEFINFWLCSIFAHAVAPSSVTTKNTGKTTQKSPQIFIVGTHRESIKGNAKEKKKKIDSAFDAIRKTIKKKPFECHVVPKYYAIENSLDDNDEQLTALRKHIEKVAIEEPYMGEEIPLRWLLFEEALAADKNNYMSLDQTKELTRRVGMESEGELLTMLTFYHDLGYIVYYGDMVEHQSLLRDIVILNPQWLIDVFKQVITILDPAEREGIVSDAWSILEEDGILEDHLIQHMWQDFLEQKEALMEIMAKFDLICEVPAQRPKQEQQDRNDSEVSEETEVIKKRYYVPSRLTSPFPDEEMGQIESSLDFYVDFRGFLPDGLFHRLMTRTVVWMGEQKYGQPVSLFYRHISLMADKEHRALFKMLPHNEATIKVTVFRPDVAESDEKDVSSDHRPPNPNAVREVIDFVNRTLDSLRRHWAKRVGYDVCFPCPKCGKRKFFKECLNESIELLQCGQHAIPTASIKSKYGLVKEGVDSGSESPMLSSMSITKESSLLGDIYLSDLAQKIGSEWQLLGVQLGLNRADIDHINGDMPLTTVDRILAMLQLWKKRSSSGVGRRRMIEELCNALSSCSRTDLAGEIREAAGIS